MRTNDFFCHPCKYIWEMVWSKDDKITCPKCQGDKVRKLIASPIIHSKTISDSSLRAQGIVE